MEHTMLSFKCPVQKQTIFERKLFPEGLRISTQNKGKAAAKNSGGSLTIQKSTIIPEPWQHQIYNIQVKQHWVQMVWI